MPAKNLYHDAVVAALIAEGWTITHDPLFMQFGGRDLYIDLGAEQNTLAAERAGEQIAVEIQSFRGASPVRSLEEALGQYQLYRLILIKQDPNRKLFLAVEQDVYNGILSEPIGRLVLSECAVPVLVFDPDRQEVVRWIN